VRHYEIVFLAHPDQSDQVPAMVDRYRGLVEVDGGKVHRFEDWGRRPLAYPINKIHKAHYVMLNVECTATALDEIKNAFRFNDAVIRHMVISRPAAEIEPSFMLRMREEPRGDGEGREGREDRFRGRPNDVDGDMDADSDDSRDNDRADD